MALNIVALMGRLTATPELKNTSTGTAVTNFSIAVDRNYQPKGEEKKADFIDIVAWRNTAEFVCKYFQKGSMIAIQGEIQTRAYQDKDGNNRKVTEILASNVSFCGSGSKAQSNAEPAQNNQPEFTAPDVPNFEVLSSDDDLPF